MSIVLAIEPDHRQAAHLTAIVRHQVGADLVLAHTTEGALDAIGDRVPDLVLVPALLSPQDDAALAAALRVIAVAAHVRTLTIPVLSSGITPAPSGGLLSKFRKNKTTQEPEGCAPEVFGEQITAYLEEAAAERAALAELEDDPLESEPPAAPIALPVYTPVYTPTYAPVYAPVAVAPPVVEFETPSADWAYPVAAEASADHTEVPETDDDGEPLIDLSDELADMAGETDGELFDGELVGVYTISADPDQPAIESFDLLPAILESDAIVEPAAMPVRAAAAASLERVEEEFAEVDPFDAPRADITPWQPMYLTPGRLWPPMEGVPAEMPVARAEQPDWIELVASLRQDLERRREAPPTLADPLVARPSDGAHAETQPIVKKARAPKKAKPVQDEWGFFDPEQCGFSTLLAKLDEITDGPAT